MVFYQRTSCLLRVQPKKGHARVSLTWPNFLLVASVFRGVTRVFWGVTRLFPRTLEGQMHCSFCMRLLLKQAASRVGGSCLVTLPRDFLLAAGATRGGAGAPAKGSRRSALARSGAAARAEKGEVSCLPGA